MVEGRLARCGLEVVVGGRGGDDKTIGLLVVPISASSIRSSERWDRGVSR
jgi:hypothetical protein